MTVIGEPLYPPAQSFALEQLFSLPKESGMPLVETSLQGSRRRDLSLDGVECLLDSFPEGPECLFLRIAGPTNGQIRLIISGEWSIAQSPLGGLLLLPNQSDQPVYWIPRQAALRVLDPEGRILSESPALLGEWRLGGSENFALFLAEPGRVLDLTVWRFSMDQPRWLGEFETVTPLETQGVFLWGSHATLGNLAGLYQHLIHGAVYDVRWAWPRSRKCFSENEAHALYTGLAGLAKATGKLMYRLMQRQLVLSAMARQATDGGWYHGLWTDGMECHYRLHASGVHMLLDEYCIAPDAALRKSLERAAHFLAQHTDRVDGETWFLHDSLEKSPEAMASAPFTWVASRALGKSPSNMLVLNTHLDSAIALDRYDAVTGDTQHRPAVESARRAASRVVALRTAEPLYRLLFGMINLSFLPAPRAKGLPLPLRALKRIGWKFLIPRLPAIKARFPRLVMPGGYIDRELTLKTWAVDYHSINLMDLLRFYRRFGDEALYRAASDGMDFAQRVGLTARWQELKGKEYALGFWAEALYHQCTLSDDGRYRAWLADAVLLLANAGLGLPPSLLGVNPEAVTPADQTASPVSSTPQLWVVNLCRGQKREFLVVNTAGERANFQWLRGGEVVAGMSWRDAADKAIADSAMDVAPRSWVWGTE